VWVLRRVFGPIFEKSAVRTPGMPRSSALVRGHTSQVLSIHDLLSISYAGKVWQNGNTFQSWAPPAGRRGEG